MFLCICKYNWELPSDVLSSQYSLHAAHGWFHIIMLFRGFSEPWNWLFLHWGIKMQAKGPLFKDSDATIWMDSINGIRWKHTHPHKCAIASYQAMVIFHNCLVTLISNVLTRHKSVNSQTPLPVCQPDCIIIHIVLRCIFERLDHLMDFRLTSFCDFILNIFRMKRIYPSIKLLISRVWHPGPVGWYRNWYQKNLVPEISASTSNRKILPSTLGNQLWHCAYRWFSGWFNVCFLIVFKTNNNKTNNNKNKQQQNKQKQQNKNNKTNQTTMKQTTTKTKQ